MPYSSGLTFLWRSIVTFPFMVLVSSLKLLGVMQKIAPDLVLKLPLPKAAYFKWYLEAKLMECCFEFS